MSQLPHPLNLQQIDDQRVYQALLWLRQNDPLCAYIPMPTYQSQPPTNQIPTIMISCTWIWPHTIWPQHTCTTTTTAAQVHWIMCCPTELCWPWYTHWTAPTATKHSPTNPFPTHSSLPCQHVPVGAAGRACIPCTLPQRQIWNGLWENQAYYWPQVHSIQAIQ